MNKKLLLFTIFVLNSFAGCLAMDKRQPGEASSSEQHFEQADRVCVICAQEIAGVMATLPCGHRFCEDCINAWRRQEHTATCPLCRKQIPVPHDRLLPVENVRVPQYQPVQLEHHYQDAPVMVAHAPVAAPAPLRRAPVVPAPIIRAAVDAPTPEAELRDALRRNDTNSVTRLLSAHPELINFDHDAPMRLAISELSSNDCLSQTFGLPLAHFLIEHGCDARYDHDALMRAVVGTLLNFVIRNDWNPISRSILLQYFHLMHVLVEHGADVHCENDAPLFIAALYARGDVAQFLVEHGADLLAPMRLAIENRIAHVIQFLVEQGADVHFDDEAPMRIVAVYGTADMIQYLLGRGDWRTRLAYWTHSSGIRWAVATVLSAGLVGAGLIAYKKSKKE